MRVVVLSYESLYSSMMLGYLLDARPDEVVGVVLSSCVIQGKGPIASLLHVLRRAGPEFFLKKSIETLEYNALVFLWRLLGRPRKVRTVDEVARRCGVPIIHSADVNARDTVDWIAGLEPDLIASVYLNQWIGQPLIDVASRGCINIHPALLPHHRGLFPYFWVLCEGDSETGVTVHYVERRFDAGAIIAQEPIPVGSDDTIQSLSHRSAVVGGPLLVEAIGAVERGDPGRPQPVTGASYHSWPSSEAYRRFRRSGRKFGSLAQLISYL